MTIGNQVSAIFEHPFFKQAVKAYSLGNEKDLKFIFQNLMTHTYLTVAQDCGRAFRLNKWGNHPEIYAAIKDVSPPTSLNLYMPIPPVIVEKECKVVPLKVIKQHKIIKRVYGPNQLELLFPILNKKASRLLQEA